jgi:putative copper resistance protein D
MGSWLSSIASPDRPGEQEFSSALSIVGINTPGEPTLSRVLFGYEPNSLIIGVLVLLVALYIKGVVVLTKRGDKWPVGRTISFALGISAVDFATSGGLGLYANFSFSYHMIAHNWFSSWSTNHFSVTHITSRAQPSGARCTRIIDCSFTF